MNNDRYNSSDNVSLNGNENGIRKLNPNTNSLSYKYYLINELKKCNYRTPPKTVANLLQQIFNKYNSRSTHWPFIAQTYTPKTIKSVLNKVIRRINSGYSVKNPAAYFTFIIQKRKRRKTSI